MDQNGHSVAFVNHSLPCSVCNGLSALHVESSTMCPNKVLVYVRVATNICTMFLSMGEFWDCTEVHVAVELTTGCCAV